MYSSSKFGRLLAGLTTTLLGIGLISDCIDIQIMNRNIVYFRTALDDCIVAELSFGPDCIQACTVRTLITYNKNFIKKSSKPIIYNYRLNHDDRTFENYEVINSENACLYKMINDYKNIVVVGGLGLKDRNGIELLKRLAKLLDADIGATKALVDVGLIEREFQLGQSGRIIAPQICLTFGVSGATQHMLGICDSKMIVSVNSDKNANIFKYSHYSVVADAKTILKEIINILKDGSKVNL